jgi:DNA-binding NarL/FixJ family response regulator
MTSVVIADDHVLFADGVSQALAAVPDIDVLGSAANGRELIDLLDGIEPDVLLIDLEMPELDGLAALREMEGRHPPAIVVTMHATAERREAAREAGAAGFLSKSTPLPDLAAAIRAAAAGETILEPATLREILDGYQQVQFEPGAASLTARERELLAVLAQGVSSTEDLADQLFISQKTVKNHLANIYEKLGVSDRTQAAVEAIRLGLVPK